MPSIASGNASNDDRIYVLYHEIVMSNAEVDRLVRRQGYNTFLEREGTHVVVGSFSTSESPKGTTQLPPWH